MSNNIYRELVRAVANGDSEESRRLDAQLTDEQRKDYHTFSTLFFGAILAEWFEDDQSHEAVMRFVDYMSNAYRTLEPPIDRVTLELLVRGFLGEESLFDSVPADEQIRLQLLGIRAITHQIPKVADNFDAYLNDTEMIMSELD